MDSAKLSLISKATNVNNGEGNETPKDEMADQWRDSGGGEWQKDTEIKEPDNVNGPTTTADTILPHKGAADTHKLNSLGYHRRTKQKVVKDLATLSKGTSAYTKPRAALRQVLFSQGVSDKNPTPEVRGQLEVLKQALEAFPVPVDLRWGWEEHTQGTTLENSWTEMVHSHTTMSKIQRHQQEALWEFVHTELSYINKLTVIKDLVIAALVNLHQNGFLLEITPELLFSNLPLILNAHCQFWQEVIHPMLQEVRRTGKPFDPMGLEAGCLQFSERFSCYMPYCWEGENTLEFARRQMDTNPHFLTYLMWVESHPECGRMRLGDMQAKPHQRITKYPLLLKALLKNTLDPQIQQTIRGMLSSVNCFLETINDYLRFKDEELALSISAQRVEGYEVSGINEEIDKHVREICHFDLTCPMGGVGHGVVRKLLLEENLKIRGRKDNKLEVVALLFSDVLLMTKVQKKAERLKVIRPPLALDRTCCVALKDGYSFLLVEVSELGCAMNVYIFVTATAESASTWVSTIHLAKEKLKNLRETETNSQLDNQRNRHFEIKPVMEAKGVTMETVKQSLEQSTDHTFVDRLVEEPVINQSANGFLRSSLIETEQENNAEEWIEMKVRNPVEKQREGALEFRGINERRVTWNHSKPSERGSSFLPGNTADSVMSKSKEPHNLFTGRYPEVDYPTAQPNTLLSPPSDLHLMSSSIISKTGRNSCHSLSAEEEPHPEMWRFSRKLKSPRLRRRRHNSGHKVGLTQMNRNVSRGSDMVWTALDAYSSSNSDSDSNPKIKGNFGQNTNSHRVLKLGSLKLNEGMFWNMPENRLSPDPETFSEPELTKDIQGKERPKIKSQRSSSIADIIFQDGHELHTNSASILPRIEMVPSPHYRHDSHLHFSPVEDLLQRAKVRARDRQGVNKGRNRKMVAISTWYLTPSPSFSTTPSPSASDGDRETEWEEVELLRRRALSVSKGWREQLVDGDEEDKKCSRIFLDEVNVDWPGWCFDDDEVMDHLTPAERSNGDKLILEDRTLTAQSFKGIIEQHDGESSQV